MAARAMAAVGRGWRETVDQARVDRAATIASVNATPNTIRICDSTPLILYLAADGAVGGKQRLMCLRSDDPAGQPLH